MLNQSSYQRQINYAIEQKSICIPPRRNKCSLVHNVVKRKLISQETNKKNHQPFAHSFPGICVHSLYTISHVVFKIKCHVVARVTAGPTSLLFVFANMEWKPSGCFASWWRFVVFESQGRRAALAKFNWYRCPASSTLNKWTLRP